MKGILLAVLALACGFAAGWIARSPGLGLAPPGSNTFECMDEEANLYLLDENGSWKRAGRAR